MNWLEVPVGVTELNAQARAKIGGVVTVWARAERARPAAKARTPVRMWYFIQASVRGRGSPAIEPSSTEEAISMDSLRLDGVEEWLVGMPLPR